MKYFIFVTEKLDNITFLLFQTNSVTHSIKLETSLTKTEFYVYFRNSGNKVKRDLP